MRRELWPVVEAALAAALEQPEAQRLAWVAGACPDPEVRAEVETLLNVYSRAENFLGSPVNGPASDGPRLTSGSHVGPYEIVAMLGAGGMGEVYRARDPRIGREVAIKVLPSQFATNPDRLRRFAIEVRAAGSLSHPNIMAIYDVGAQEGVPYVVAELLEGETLRTRLKRGALPLPKALEYALGISSGLAAAHSKGIIHRDLKPENLFVTRNGPIKILDFGLARLSHREPAGAQETETAPGMILGTAAYMSPEQVRGEPCDHRSDIFSLGSILFEALTGERAFAGASPIEIMSAVLTSEPPDLVVPGAVARVLRRCLEKNPDERFQSTNDLVFSLESLSKDRDSRPDAMPVPVDARKKRRLLLALAALVLLAAYTAGVFFAGSRISKSEPPFFHQLTFRRGSILSARFAPDGRTVVFGASWEGNPLDIFLTRPESPESRSLGLPNTEVLAVSPTGEMAVALHRRYYDPLIFVGTLARTRLEGGVPREILEGVQEADWAPDGSSLAAIVFDGARSRLEFPIGKILHQSSGWLSNARISPKGDSVAFLEHGTLGDDSGSVVVVDLAGTARTLSAGWQCTGGLAWSPDGKEIWFTAARTGNARALMAVSLAGRDRLVVRVAGALILHDISRNGAILLTRDHARGGIVGLAAGETKERDLSWLDNSGLRDIASDGKSIVFNETGEGGGPRYSVYLRKMDGSPAVRLGDGGAFALSPDGKWVLGIPTIQRTRLTILPTGTGTSSSLSEPGLHYQYAAWFLDGKRILAWGNQPGRKARLYVQSFSDGALRPITPEGVTAPRLAPSPDGRFALARGPDDKMKLFPVDGGTPLEVAGLTTGEPVQWGPGGRFLYVHQGDGLPSKVYKLDLSTGRAELWKLLMPSDPAGISGIGRLVVTQDGTAYAYAYSRLLSNLYLVEGLK